MVARRHKRYDRGEGANYVTRKQAMRKLQLNLNHGSDKPRLEMKFEPKSDQNGRFYKCFSSIFIH